ncbi:hypothetical protein STEG23_025081 [Scotinomys teguina]
MTVTPLGRDQDCSLKNREPDVPAPWFLDPGGWSKTAAVRLYFIFPGICTLSLVLCNPAPTSARTASPEPARGHRGTRHSVQLGLNDLGEPQSALNEAAQAAENVHFSTCQLSRSLSADLHLARSLRGSCLF